jgi:hypothetical protein
MGVAEDRQELKANMETARDLARQVGENFAVVGKFELSVPNHGSVHPMPQGMFVDMVLFIPTEAIDHERARANETGDDRPERPR